MIKHIQIPSNGNDASDSWNVNADESKVKLLVSVAHDITILFYKYCCINL